MGNEITVREPIRLIGGSYGCYRCGDGLQVVAIAATVEEDGRECVVLLSYVESLSEDLLAAIVDRFPCYGMVESQTAELVYFGIECPRCGAIAGDFFLQSAGGVFGPLDQEAANALHIERLPLVGPYRLRAEYEEQWWLDCLV